MRDIVVVGGGPAGLWFAAQMAAQGYDTVLFDERDWIGRSKICTGIIGAEAFEKLSLPRDSVLNQIQDLKFISPQGRALDYHHPELLAHVVDRAAFDHSLAELAVESGAEVLPGRRATRVQRENGYVEVNTETVRGEEQFRIRARLLVIATGVNVRFNSVLGLGSPTSFLNAVQAHLRVTDALECTHCFSGRGVAPGAFAWLVPLNRGWARVGLMTDQRSSRFFEHLLQRIAAFRAEPDAPVSADFKPIVQGFEGRSFADRVIAVGEAAGQVKSTTGGGIYYGLIGAQFAVETAVDGLRRDRLDAAHLRRYERAWKSRLSGEIEAGALYRRAFSRLSDRQIEALFKLAGWNGIIPLVKRTARFDWHLELLTTLIQYGPIRSILGVQSIPAAATDLDPASVQS